MNGQTKAIYSDMRSKGFPAICALFYARWASAEPYHVAVYNGFRAAGFDGPTALLYSRRSLQGNRQ
ncbi:hypothetical protein LCM4573_26965 [Rhizobium sp. LCM 4573]|nr:hypothetical protein LCM4573_26965 [Rhizobium sp. LCM 4573]